MLKQDLGCTHVHHDGDLGQEVKVPGGWLPIPGYKEASKSKAKHKTKGIEYNMSSFVEQCVSAYLELAGLPATKLSAKAATPFTDETNAFMTDEPEGKLTNIALKVLMKILYAARYCRPDLLRATCALARRVSKWTTECDRRLHILVSYMHLTVNNTLMLATIFPIVRLLCLLTPTTPEIKPTAGQHQVCSSLSSVHEHMFPSLL